MTKSPEKYDPVAIRIEGCKNVRLDNNISVGMPLLHATDIDNLSGSGNRAFVQAESLPAFVSVPRKAWHEHSLAKVGSGILIAVVTAGIVYALGWN